jgi:HNH endonuclease
MTYCNKLTFPTLLNCRPYSASHQTTELYSIPTVRYPPYLSTMSDLANQISPAIHERTSSLLSPACKERVEELSESSDRLKRKASTLSQRSLLCSTDFVDAQLELSQTNCDLYSTLFHGLKEAWEAGAITGDEFKNQGRSIWKKKLYLNKERTTLQQHREAVIKQMVADYPTMAAAYRVAVMTNFTAHSGPPSRERRNKHHHDKWKQSLRELYNAVLPPGSTSSSDGPILGEGIWCPITKQYAGPLYRCAAHIIPHFIGYENVAWMLGDEGDIAAGFSHIWNLRNGLIMSKDLEKRFDAGDVVIVPIPTENGAPQRLRLLLLNPALGHHRYVETGKFYSELDGTELEFKGNWRPGLRYLYWHYVMSILRAAKWETAGWDDLKKRFPDGPIWATPGPYLRKSIVQQLGMAIGDYEVKEEFTDGVCDGAGQKSPIDEKAIAADVAERLEISSDDDSGWSDDDA